MLALIAASVVMATPSAEPVASQTLPPIAPSLAAAYGRGASYERVVLANEYRGWYGIALFKPAFEADLAAFDSGVDFPKAPKDPLTTALRTYLRSGDTSSFSEALGQINTIEPFAKHVPANGGVAWFVEAGMADADIRGAAGNFALQALAAVHPVWLRDHASLGGAYATAIGLEPAHAAQADLLGSVEPKIVDVFERALPSKPFVDVAYPDGPVGLARLGVSVATLNQMIDMPSLLAQPPAQAFVDRLMDAIGRIGAASLSPDQVADLRRALVVNAKFDHDTALSMTSHTVLAMVDDLQPADKDRFLVGLLAAQTAYNAVVFRDPNAQAQQDGALGQFAELDDVLPAVRSLRTKLSAVPAGDWPDVIKLGRSLVDAIEH